MVPRGAGRVHAGAHRRHHLCDARRGGLHARRGPDQGQARRRRREAAQGARQGLQVQGPEAQQPEEGGVHPRRAAHAGQDRRRPDPRSDRRDQLMRRRGDYARRPDEEGPGGAARAASTDARRHCDHHVHERHDGRAQGRDDHARQRRRHRRRPVGQDEELQHDERRAGGLSRVPASRAYHGDGRRAHVLLHRDAGRVRLAPHPHPDRRQGLPGRQRQVALPGRRLDGRRAVPQAVAHGFRARGARQGVHRPEPEDGGGLAGGAEAVQVGPGRR